MKPFIVIQGPVATRSGYGNHTRDLVTSLIKSDKYDIQIISLPWGSTPMDALKADNPEHVSILQRIARQPINRQPDVFIQVSVPNEFQAPGKYNIGITAGIETDAVPAEWIDGCNRMNLIITTSEHSKQGFITPVYDVLDKNTNQKTGELKLQTPIKVLFEGVDTNVYKQTKDVHETVLNELSDIKDTFCYLFVGHWLKGDFGADRKDVATLIKTFCEAFKNKSAHNRPGLILKTSHATFSIMDRDELMRKIQAIIAPYGKNIPNIYLVHGDLTDEEMNSLYNHPKVKAMVSFTHGEGYGRPLLEFSITGKPVIAPNWSGHVDFLKHATLLPGQLTQVHPSAADQFILKDTKWFTVDYGYAAAILRDCIDNYKTYQEKARKQAFVARESFNLDKMSEEFVSMIDEALNTVPKVAELKLPKLNKVENNNNGTLPKITLPKLNKVTI
jgi:glycosyltransferase involved in cell wall biosynthesis